MLISIIVFVVYLIGIVIVPATFRCLVGDGDIGIHNEADKKSFAMVMGIFWPFMGPLFLIIILTSWIPGALVKFQDRMVSICRKHHH